ncbi:MAG: YhgE/Pip domain-containing protein [Bacilli bacterium]|nr:YhgE/Pip domain-containing protein [Bacilli bacterium]
MQKIKRDSNKMKLMVILGIIILPLVYSLFYLKGFWDPYNSLDNIPVALVNLDECSENCKGDELIETLKEKDVFDFKVVSEKEASSGLIDKKYYAVIKIPKDFTSNLESAANKNRQQATITYMPNTKTSYLASQIIGTAVKEIESELTSEVNKEIVSKLTNNLQDVPNQTKQISDAFGTLSNGTNTLNNGALELKNGINKLSTNYRDFNNGVEKLFSGASTLNDSYKKFNDGIDKVYDGANTLKTKTDGIGVLVSKVGELKAGSDTFTNGLDNYQNSSNQMIDNTNMAYNKLIQYVESNPGLSDANLLTAYQIAKSYTDTSNGTSGLEQLRGGLNSLVIGNKLVNDGINLMNGQVSSVNELKGGIDLLEAGLFELKSNSDKVYNGISDINKGLSMLNDNSKLINNGLNSADKGAGTLAIGTDTLNNGVNNAKNTIDDKSDSIGKQTEVLDGLSDYAKDPVKINEEDYGEVKDYGTFFSPYFMSLSLWVGGILILMGLYYDPDHRFKILGRKSENRGKRLVIYNVIGIIQAILLAFILQMTLGFEVTNGFVYYGSCILISEAFLAIIMFLFFNFQDIGKFLALVFLVMQLAACGGTFPIQTEPSVYQAIYPFMPMTYSVDLLRESFVNINSSFLIKDITILVLIMVVFNGLTFVTSMSKARKEQKAK